MSGLRQVLRTSLKLLVLGFFGTLILIIRYFLKTPHALANTLPGEPRIYKWSGGHIFYKILGSNDAPPVVLLHAPEIGASSHEMSALLPQLAQHYQVYALDLLGFGLSDRPNLAYCGETYVDLVQDFLREVVSQPATILASGLSCNYALALADRTPELCQGLVLLSPVSLFRIRKRQPWLSWLSGNAFGSLALYALLTPRPVLHRLAARQRGKDYQQLSPGEIDPIYANAHQLGAQHTALALLRGDLELEVQPETVQQPTLIIWGVDTLNRYRSLVSERPLSASTQVTLIQEAGTHVHEEHPSKVITHLLEWRETLTQSRTVIQQTETSADTSSPDPVDTVTTLSEVSPHPAPIQEEEPVQEPLLAYCVKCRQKRAIQNPKKVVTKNGRNALEGTCSICHTRLFRFTAGS